jgi:pyrroloquinoline quinone biosynthesis protein D
MVGSYPRLASKARLQTDPVTGNPALLYPEGVLLLNPSAAAILELCDGKRDLGSIAAQLAEKFKSPMELILPDLEKYILELRSKGLVQVLDVPEGNA